MGCSTSFPNPDANGLYSLNRDNLSFDEGPLVTGDDGTVHFDHIEIYRWIACCTIDQS